MPQGPPGGVDDKLSEAEAQGVVSSLRKYDQGFRIRLGIDRTLKEYKTLGGCFFMVPGYCQDFISSYPKSKYLPASYFSLGNHSFYGQHDPASSIAVFEELISKFPRSNEAAEALRALINISRASSPDDEKAFAYSSQWLKRPPYPLIGVHSAPPSYAEGRNYVLLFRAEYFRNLGKASRAKKIYQAIVRGKGEDYSKRVAQGALYDLEKIPEYKKHHADYLGYKYAHLFDRAQQLLYENKDFPKAESICREILSRKDELESKEYLLNNAAMMLTEIRLRKTVRLSRDALKAVADLKRGKELDKFFSYLGALDHDLNGIPAEIYLQFLLLKHCQDVSDVRLVNFSKFDSIDPETKTSSNYYYVFYRIKGAWVLADSQDQWQTDNLKSVLEGLAKSTRAVAYTVPWKGPALFPDSLAAANEPFRLSTYEAVMALEKEKAPAFAQKMFSSVKTEFDGNNNKDNKEWVLSFAQAFSLLPQSHFLGLKKVSLVEEIKIENKTGFAGVYKPGSKSIEIVKEQGSDTAVHELTHHWDRAVALGKDGNNLSEGDPSLLFYKISWDAWSNAACGYIGKPCGGWERKTAAGEDDFARDYGMSDGLEDMATSAESYVEGEGNLTRKIVREQMKKGNFEPAAKYLFHKYIRSFDERDGLCFEYNITAEDPLLSMAEVKKTLAAWLKEHPDSVAQSTLTAIEEIEEEYKKLKANRSPN